MLSSIINVVALLALTGIGVYIVVATPLLRDRLQVRRVLVGVVIGLMTAVMGYLDIAPDAASYMTITIGPLLMAGFVGGLWGALVAAVLSALPFVLVPSIGAVLGQHLFAAGLGAALSYAAFGTKCIRFSTPVFITLALLAGAFTAAHALLFPYDPPASLQNSLAMALASTAIAYGMLAMAMRSARNIRALAEFESRMQMASQVAQIGTWDWDVSSDECTWDGGMHRLYGTDPSAPKISPGEFIQKVHPDDRMRLQTTYEAVSLGGAPQHDEFRAFHSDGTIRTIHSALRNQHDASGRLVRISGLHMDVTNLRLAEALRGAAETRLHDVVTNVPGAILTYRVDREGGHSVTYLNPFCEELLELPAGTVEQDGRALFRVVHKDDMADLSHALNAAIEGVTPFVHRWRMILPSGRMIWIEGRGTPHPLEGGGIEFSAFLIDITDLVQAQADLAAEQDRTARADRLQTIGKLSGGVAHDFNNLLAIIVGNLELLKEELSGDDQRLGFVREGLDASLRGADLVRNMLNFAQRARLQPEAHAVSDLLTRVESWVMRVLPATLNVKVDIPDDILPIHVDPAGAENALVNLVLNARDAMPDGGTIRITARNVVVAASQPVFGIAPLRPGNYVKICVCDDGHGIAPEDSERVFEPFYSTREPGKTSGSGLGLPSVRGFIEQSGGGITVDSTPGEGTQVILYVPTDTESINAAEAAAQATPIQAAPSGLRILLAEDEAPVAQVLKRALELEGYEVCAAPSGDAAVTLYEQEGPFDLLLSDIVMPGQLQGPDLAAALRVNEPNLPAVFLSGYAPETVFDSSGIRASDPRLMKPVTRQELVRTIAAALQSRHRTTAAE